LNTEALIAHLRSLDIALKADGDKLRLSAPKGVLTDELRSQISAQKAEILEQLRASKGTALDPIPQLPPLDRVAREGDEVLSWSQQRLWFLDQMDPDSPSYNVPIAYRLTGQLDIRALERSVEEIVRRHEVLRASFPSREGQPVQVFSPSPRVSIHLEDLRVQPAREEEAARLTTEELQRPFDLASGPLLRLLVLRLAEDDHVVMLTVHHIAFDVWSFGVLKRELSALYAGLTRGEPASLPELPVQYADFAAWQHRCVDGKPLERQVAYWKKQLEGCPALLDLPTDRPRPARPNLRGTSVGALLPTTLAGDLKRSSREEGASLFMLMLAAFGVLLHRLTDQDDLAVGSPIAGRRQPELEGLIGFFVNTLVLRLELAGNPSLRDLLGRVREMAFGAYAHQELPFGRLVDELQPARVMSHSPLFQVMFALQNTPSEELELEGLTSRHFPVENTTAKFDLSLYIEETKEGLDLRLEYSTDLFERDTIVRWLGHYERLLEGIVANPEARIFELPLLTSSEQRQLLEKWNDTRRAYPREACLPSLFEQQARQSPHAIAVANPTAGSGAQQLSYDELARRANQLARYLSARGVGPEVGVGICVDRGLDMIVGILGILKAGGAYVPLDPGYPKERLAFMIEDAKAPVLLTQARHLSALPEQAAEVVCLDSDWQAISAESDGPISQAATPDSLAYVIYTSGSTGRPKGVAVSHRAIARLVLNTDYAELDASDRIAQVSNCSFDAATFEIWGALLHGARLVIIPKEVLLAPREFAAVLREHEISAMFLTTALFNQVAREVPDAFASLTHLLFGGEAVDPRWVEAVLSHGPPRRLLHVYGPTESTTFATSHLVASIPHEAPSIPIGRPIANTRAFVLDRFGQPVPIGVPGELYLGGDGLARSYLNRPGLTAERFVPNPFAAFGAEPGERLYRTGDRVRTLADGSIEFLGRIDHQVKIRGFRIELGEIEAVLCQHEDVADAAVLAREDVPGNKRLVGYVVASEGACFDGGALRRDLQQRLPGYMVPAVMVPLDALPLNPNGKVDRKALPAPDGAHPGSTDTFVAPRTPLEGALAKIWCEVLELSEVGVHDSFFELGGHSLLATQVVSLVRDSLQADVALHRLFQAPTIDGLANTISEIFGDRETAEEVARTLAWLERLTDEKVREALGE
jgi:aspartate racemase